MSFPADPQWLDVQAFLKQYAQPTDAILAPIDFLEMFPAQTYPYNVSTRLPVNHFGFVVFHKAMLSEIDPTLALEVLDRFQPVYGNAVFVVYAQTDLKLPSPDENDLKALLLAVQQRSVKLESRTQPRWAAVMVTHNQAGLLARSLAAIADLKIPMVVVDDGSIEPHRTANQILVEQYGAQLLALPTHQGAAAAINVGVGYWLTQPEIQWISCFQDNVQVQAELRRGLEAVQHPQNFPLLTGYDAPEHASVGSQPIGDYRILLKQATSGVHLHAHRDYWQGVLPVPPLYSQSQLAAGQSSDADWWITAWSPRSILKQGGQVACLPGLVTQLDPSRAVDLETILSSAPQMPSLSTGSVPLQFSTPPDRSTPVVNPAVSQPLAADLSLQDVKVLVDGYNLQLTKGTGIKTYGLSLMEGLNQLGASVDILLSRGGYRSNPILDEVFFFDNQSDRQDWITLGKWLLKSLSPFYRAKRRKSFAGLVVKRGKYTEDFLKYATSFSLPQCYDLANGLYSRLKLTTQISIAEKVDVWHATYPLPMNVRGAKKITTIHDLIPLRLPYATLDSKKVFYNKLRDSLKDSAVTITVSENSKQDILTYYDVDPAKIIVTYQPIALPPLEATDEEVEFFLRRYGLEYQNYLLFVGAIEPKKNVGRLLDAYASMDVDMPLVIVGKKGWLWEDELGRTAFMFEGKDNKKKVKLLEYISADSLRYIYRGAYCLVFPSLYEGFGLPPLEAMNFGCPVITSNLSCLPEICGDAALYVDPYNVRDIQDKLETLLGDPHLRSQLVRAGTVNAKTFSMQNYVQRLHQAYTTALNG
ncbi:MAG: glycosyltransferase [Elainella sp. Prado103]|jgi:glycosyltransferase involved in cell wall biosynthesis|nr:glycosyltransferase [Elainella sp. Prado103]